MSKVKKLPKEVVIRIAAGEAVERPGNVVKELIENALDAGATNISITIENAGLKKIEVIDNGEGMTKKDLEKSVVIHTTSKIKQIDDLSAISTFGFRGEALASIGAVSVMTVRSRMHNEIKGHEVVVDNGEIYAAQPVGMPEGTHITVEDLYAKIPARKKLAESRKSRELRHIIDIVTSYTIGYPKVRFMLKHNKKVLVDEQAGDSMDERMHLLFQKKISEMLPLLFEDDDIHIRGYVGKPSTYHSTKRKQLLFLNNRPVTSKEIERGIKNAYGKGIKKEQYPLFAIHMDIPLNSVDVNIHPRKEKVELFHESKVIEALNAALQKVLHKSDSVQSFEPHDIFAKDEGMDTYMATHIRDKSGTGWSMKEIQNDDIEVIQLSNLYLIFSLKDKLLLMDQHAAHERILYEEYAAKMKKSLQTNDSVELKKPVIIEVTPSEYEEYMENIEQLREYGFRIEDFGRDTFRVVSIPRMMKARNIEETIRELLNSNDSTGIDDKSDATIAYMACREAIKAGDHVTSDEAKKLLAKLFECDHPLTCPHSRPTVIEISKKKLDEMFKRI